MFVFQTLQKEKTSPDHLVGLDILKDQTIQKTNTQEYQQAGLVSLLSGDGFLNFSSTFNTIETMVEVMILGSLAWAGISGAAKYTKNRVKQKLGDMRTALSGKYGETFEGKYTKLLMEATVDNPQVQQELYNTAQKRGITLEALKEEIWANTTNKLTFSAKELQALDDASQELTKAFTEMEARIAKGENLQNIISDFNKAIQKQAHSLRELFNGKGGFSLKNQLTTAFDYGLKQSGVNSSAALTELAKAELVTSANKMQKFTAQPATIRAMLKMSPKAFTKGAYNLFKKVYLPTAIESERAQTLYSKNIIKPDFWLEMSKDAEVQAWFIKKYGALEGKTKTGQTITIEGIFKNKNNHNMLLENAELKKIFIEKSLTKWDRWGKSALTAGLTLGILIGTANYFQSQGTEEYNNEINKEEIIEKQSSAAQYMKNKTSFQNFIVAFPKAIVDNNLNWTNANYIAAATLSKTSADHMEPPYQQNVAYATSSFYEFDTEAQSLSPQQKTYTFNVTLPPLDNEASPLFIRSQVGFQPTIKDNHKVGFNGLPEVGFDNGYIKFGAGKEKIILNEIPYATQLTGKNATISITLIPPNLSDNSDMGSALISVKIPGASPSMQIYNKQINLNHSNRRLYENGQLSAYEMVPSMTLEKNRNFKPKQE